MTASRTARPARMAALLLAPTLLAGCETFGNPLDVITGNRSTPDEFQVLARKPLRMPGTINLPEPRLGAPSPLEPDARTAAIVALLGAPAAVPVPGASGTGERALLEAATASANRPTALSEIEAAEARIDANQTYQPPTIAELFQGSDEEGAEDALNPAAEARRLQSEGVSSAPIDPSDRPEEVAPPAERSAEGVEERLDNRQPRAPTEAAF